MRSACSIDGEAVPGDGDYSWALQASWRHRRRSWTKDARGDRQGDAEPCLEPIVEAPGGEAGGCSMPIDLNAPIVCESCGWVGRRREVLGDGLLLVSLRLYCRKCKETTTLRLALPRRS
jgi:hypothetical protein